MNSYIKASLKGTGHDVIVRTRTNENWQMNVENETINYDGEYHKDESVIKELKP